MQPDDCISKLLAFPSYSPAQPIALYTHTDAFSTAFTQQHLLTLLNSLRNHNITNPLIIITKCQIPNNAIAEMVRLRESGLKIVVYLSYSGLGPTIERGIRIEPLRANFPNLNANSIPIVHYWRPIMPQNSQPEIVTEVLLHASKYAECSVLSGYKIPINGQMQAYELWPELREQSDHYDVLSFYPREFFNELNNNLGAKPEYAIYQNNACALSHVLDNYNSHAAKKNSCPTATLADGQIIPCVHSPHQGNIGPDVAVKRKMIQLGYSPELVEIDPHLGIVKINKPITSRVAGELAMLGFKVEASRDQADTYWSSRLLGAQPRIIE